MMRPAQSGYLITALAACVAIVTVWYLSLAAYSARVQDGVEAKQAEMAAYYAAESGILLAEHHLRNPGSPAPPKGLWLAGELPSSLARFKVEVRTENYAPDGFTIHSIGQAPGERGLRYTSTFKVRLKMSPKKKWVVEWREQQ